MPEAGCDRSESRPVDDRTERPLGRLHRRPPWRVPCARAGPVTVRPPATSALTPGGRTHTAYRTPFPHGRPGERCTSDPPTAPERRRRAVHREPRRVPGDGRRARGRHRMSCHRPSCSPLAVVFAHAGDVPGRRDLNHPLTHGHAPGPPVRTTPWTTGSAAGRGDDRCCRSSSGGWGRGGGACGTGTEARAGAHHALVPQVITGRSSLRSVSRNVTISAATERCCRSLRTS